jgi:quinolinate synthase
MSVLMLQKRIRELLRDKHAILLAHYYQQNEIQEIADILGDSLALSMGAAKTDAKVLVFAGVHFMAESAAILSPDKTVLLPRLEAGCPLADTITVEQLQKAKNEHPDATVVTYINSSAAVKAHSDICCTSSNAVAVVNALHDAKKILMIPDGNLARHVAAFAKKEIIAWDGYCPVHQILTEEEVKQVREKYPYALFAAHPECSPGVLSMADFVGSTSAILRFAKSADVTEIIVGTEMGVLCQLEKQNPQKVFILASKKMLCETMKKITLEDILDALLEMKHIIKVPEEIRIPAKKALDRMLEIT